MITSDCLLGTASHVILFLFESESVFWTEIGLIWSSKSLLFFPFKSAESVPQIRMD